MMDAIYKGGHSVPENVMDALKYIGKVGVMSRETWNQCFSKGTLRWKRKQLQHLVERKIVRAHTCGSVENAFVIADHGATILKKMNWPLIQPIPPQYIIHDETVAKAIIELERKGFCQRWFTERELKSLNSQEYLIQNINNETKYPDAILKMMIREKPRTVAIEYERTGKALSRYRSILWQYNGINNISMILYVVEDNTIKKRIKTALKYQGETAVSERLAFVNVNEWILNPLSAPIELKSSITSFNKLCVYNTA